MNVNIVPVPQVQPGAVPQDAEVGNAVKILADTVNVDHLRRAVGGDGVPDAVLGLNFKRALQWVAADVVEQGALQGIQQGVQQGMQPIQHTLQQFQQQFLQFQQQQQQFQQQLQQDVQQLQELAVGSFNLASRMHNRTAPTGNNPLLPLRKEQHPAAPPGAAVFGALPPPGMFPADAPALYKLIHAQLDALAAFYEEDFGQQGAQGIDQRKGMFLNFINRI